MKKMTSGYERIIIGFALSILIIIGIGVSSYRALQRQMADSEAIHHTYRVISKVTLAEKLCFQMAAARRAYRATQEKANLVDFHHAESQLPIIMQELKQLIDDNPNQVRNHNRLSEEVNGITAFWKLLNNESEFRFTKEGNKIVTNQENDRLTAVRGMVESMEVLERSLLQLRIESTEKASRYAATIIVLGSLVAGVLVTILIIIILRELTVRRNAEKNLEENLERINHLHELGQKQNWTIAGSQQLAEGILGNETVDAVAQKVLEIYLGYMKLPAGALHIFHIPGRGSQTFVYGLASRETDTTKPHHYVLKVAESGKPHFLNQVPDGLWQLQSAFGEAQPGMLGYWPINYDGKILAVLELAVYEQFRDRKLEFIKATLPTLANALYSAINHEQISRLLEQVQRQSEELRTQQEELRQSNNELVRQAAILQSSEEELRVQQEELVQANDELLSRNEAILKAQETITAKARELEMTNRYKSEFLANMSHELRTPLNSVLILARLLQENKQKNLTPKQEEYAAVIHKSGTDLLNLINDILDLSKIEARKVDYHFGKVPVSAIIADLMPGFEVVAAEKGVQFETQIHPEATPSLYTDKSKVEQILRNLLSNAFKFTGTGGKVSLVVAKATDFNNKDSVVFRVQDTGIGIPEDKQEMIFEAFRQADGSTSRKYGGTGLGLSISRELSRNLGGTIRLESVVGQGSTFSFIVPVDGPPASASEIAAAEMPAISLPEDTRTIPVQTLLPDDRNSIEEGDKIMLIIEDDVRFAAIVRDFAQQRGYKAILAIRGDEGLMYARKYLPDAIIMDLQLPVIDGWSLMKKLKEDANLQHIPVHILSAAEKSTLNISGALAIARKPLEKHDLEGAFDLIAEHLTAQVEQVLIYGTGHLTESAIGRLLQERNIHLKAHFAKTLTEAREKLHRNSYQCLIADVGAFGISSLPDLQALKDEAGDLPLMVYIDTDLSTEEEKNLRRIAAVIIRESPQSKERLLDELELFHYRMQQSEERPHAEHAVIDQGAELSGRKVLLVDDDIRNVFALTDLLESRNVKVFSAMEGQEALDTMNEHPDIELVLMDIMMPGLDGYEAIRRLRADARFVRLPIIALTAKAMAGDRQRTIEAGASDYITKPIDGARLLSLMRVWLSA